MFKLFFFAALLAFASAGVVVGPVVGHSAITSHSSVIAHPSPVVAVHSAPIVPLVKAAPVVAVHHAPVVHSVHAVHPVVPIVKTVHAAPIVHLG